MQPSGLRSTTLLKLHTIDTNSDQTQARCLHACHATAGATGCEFVWDGTDRGCYVHTSMISNGNGESDRHLCWVFSSCSEPAAVPIGSSAAGIGWAAYTEPLLLDNPSSYRITARTAATDLLSSESTEARIVLEWSQLPLVPTTAFSNGDNLHLVTGAAAGVVNATIAYEVFRADVEWTDAVVLGAYGQEVLLDDPALFDSLFQQSPVVQYVRNGQIEAVYVRTSSLPSGFDAYSLFTYTWSSPNNKLNKNFELYNTLNDALAGRDRWTFCNYDDSDVGFPRDCGATGGVPNHWFSMPKNTQSPGVGRFDARGLNVEGSKFQIFTGPNCPVPSSVLPESSMKLEYAYARCGGINDLSGAAEVNLYSTGITDLYSACMNAAVGLESNHCTTQADCQYDGCLDGAATEAPHCSGEHDSRDCVANPETCVCLKRDDSEPSSYAECAALPLTNSNFVQLNEAFTLEKPNMSPPTLGNVTMVGGLCTCVLLCCTPT